jgi:hypothetical protein
MKLTPELINQINNIWADYEKIENFLSKEIESKEIEWNVEEIAMEITNVLAAHWRIPYFENETFLNPEF